MRSAKWLSAGMLLPALMLPLQGSIAATEVAKATVTFSGIYTVPPCSLTMPSEVRLGSMKTGTQRFGSLHIDISCSSDTIEAALYARNMSGSLSGKNRMTMTPTSGSSSGKPALFWLTDADGKDITLDGTGETNRDERFCGGLGKARRCTLTPNTEVFADTPLEETRATVRFTLGYP